MPFDLWQVGVRSVPSPGRGTTTGKRVRRAEERGCHENKAATFTISSKSPIFHDLQVPQGGMTDGSEKEGRAEWHESRRRRRANRSQEHRPKPGAPIEAICVDRSQLVDRSQSHRPKPAALRTRPRRRQPGGAARPRGPRAGPTPSVGWHAQHGRVPKSPGAHARRRLRACHGRQIPNAERSRKSLV